VEDRNEPVERRSGSDQQGNPSSNKPKYKHTFDKGETWLHNISAQVVIIIVFVQIVFVITFTPAGEALSGTVRARFEVAPWVMEAMKLNPAVAASWPTLAVPAFLSIANTRNLSPLHKRRRW
jgi:hypothetical protein